ncbi:ATP-grasp domain-containing protein [Pseudomonas fluorescens]|uniref:ATP-grasp domain-containing protein n=1 Tax=Pseudomonas fluorescens TaxID=294 RepID=UPI001252BFEA|nr:ATP-grasp domain-containing protein [Pseudomonas fluorescens]VVN84748.1 hypothetical protein PS720_01380 [Pseudomonas fluorescens]
MIATTIFVDPDATWTPVLNRSRERGFKVINISSPRYTSSYPDLESLADTTISCDTSNSKILAATLNTIEMTDRTAIITSNDGTLEVVAEAAEYQNISFTPLSAVRLARNKINMRKHLKCHGFQMPRFEAFRTMRDLERAVNTIGFPCAIKPASGHQSWFCFRLSSTIDIELVIENLNYMIDNLAPNNAWCLKNGFICEEWMDGPIISVSVAASNGLPIPICVALGTTSPDAPCAGYGSIIPYIENKYVAETCSHYAENICRTLGLTVGIFDLEMIWTKTGPVILEVNARRMGGVMPHAYDIATGDDFSDIILDAYLLLPISPRPKFTHTAVIRKIIAGSGGIIKSSLDENILKPHGHNIYYRNYFLHEGVLVDKFDVLARLISVGTSSTIEFEKLDSLLIEIEKQIEIPLLRGFLPTP